MRFCPRVVYDHVIMKITIAFQLYHYVLLILIFPYSTRAQTTETIYALNEGITTNQVVEGKPIIWGRTKPFPNASYVLIRMKSDGTFYFQTTVAGKFAYGHYFKYKDKVYNADKKAYKTIEYLQEKPLDCKYEYLHRHR